MYLLKKCKLLIWCKGNEAHIGKSKGFKHAGHCWSPLPVLVIWVAEEAVKSDIPL